MAAPNTIDRAFVTQWGRSVLMLAEQRGSKLLSTVQRAPVTGEAWTTERLGGTEAGEITNRHAPIEPTVLDHSRRWGYTNAYDRAVLIDNYDRVKTLLSFESPYTQRVSNAMGRAMDVTIIGALDATVRTGKNAESTQQLPSAQILGTSSETNPISVARLLDAKLKFDQADQEMGGLTWVCRPEDIRNLMADFQATSADFQNLKALVAGEVNTFLGMNIIWSNLIPTDNSRLVSFIYRTDAIEFGVAQEMSVTIDRRIDLRTQPWQAYAWGAWGAVRVEDNRVVKIFSNAQTPVHAIRTLAVT